MKKKKANEPEPEITLMPKDPNIKHYQIWQKGAMGVPHRFYDFILIDLRLPFRVDELVRLGYHIGDIEMCIRKYGGIKFPVFNKQ